MIKPVLDTIKARLRPDALELPVVEEALHALQSRIWAIAKHAVIVPGGSYAKGTFIRGSHDIDCFVRFPKGTTDEQMATALQEAYPEGEVLHGSRDYIQIKQGDYTFELVPVLAIDSFEQAENLMDMSPFHVEYVREHLNDMQRDDARLAKQFCKAAGIYGAESFIRGFSGYVLELLISIYGSFEKLLHAATQWHEQVVLDPAHHYQSPAQALRRLNEAKILSQLVIVDPVQKDRNAAAALSKQNFEKFREQAKAFLQHPSETFFDLHLDEQKILATHKGKHTFIIHAKTPEGKRDIVGCKVLAKHEEAIKLLQEHEFPLLEADWRFAENESVAWYVLEETTLSREREQLGPPTSMTEAVAAFRVAHAGKKILERNNKLIAIVPRQYTHAETVIRLAWEGMPLTLQKH